MLNFWGHCLIILILKAAYEFLSIFTDFIECFKSYLKCNCSEDLIRMREKKPTPYQTSG